MTERPTSDRSKATDSISPGFQISTEKGEMYEQVGTQCPGGLSDNHSQMHLSKLRVERKGLWLSSLPKPFNENGRGCRPRGRSTSPQGSPRSLVHPLQGARLRHGLRQGGAAITLQGPFVNSACGDCGLLFTTAHSLG